MQVEEEDVSPEHQDPPETVDPVPETSADVWPPSMPPQSSEPCTTCKYVDGTEGSDEYDGGSATPWKTVMKAVRSLASGETAIIRPGVYDEHVVVTTGGISLRAEGMVSVKSVRVGGAVPVDGVSILGFTINNALGYGIDVFGANCRVEENTIYFASEGGIILRTSAEDPNRTERCIVRNNRIQRCAQFGLDIRGRDHLVEGNEIWDTIQHHPARIPSPAWADADGIHFHGSGHLFKNNYIHDIVFDGQAVIDSHTDCFQTFVAENGRVPAHHIVFDGNRCINPQYHSSVEAATGFMIADASDLVFKNNVVVAYVGIHAGKNSLKNSTIVNNTFVGILDPAILKGCQVGVDCWPVGIVLQAASTISIFNNIFYHFQYRAMELKGTANVDIVEDYNLVFRADAQPAVGRLPSPNGIHDLWDIDPLFVDLVGNDFRLLPTSPALHAGTTVENDHDIAGSPRPSGSGFDLGAYEHTSK
ncbi:MAG: hypothetical protein A2284_10280 [Deltaproteobacteria bacterium RIFOXYA12_FULL_61_11]|nr:MAG: hypothetical protein A2284_10280 [Deltaproteobacteria bacterium RIFOXYA12_FULL_61_11]